MKGAGRSKKMTKDDGKKQGKGSGKLAGGMAVADADAAHGEMAWGAAWFLGRLLTDLNPDAAAAAASPSTGTSGGGDTSKQRKKEAGHDSNAAEALRALDRCIGLDPDRIECHLQKLRLLLTELGRSLPRCGAGAPGEA